MRFLVCDKISKRKEGVTQMIILFCGIPGCGKTTIAKKLAKHLKKLGRTKIFISDKLRPPVYQKFFKLLEESMGTYKFLIFDATFYKKKWRDKVADIAKNERVLVVYLDCTLPTALKRNKKRHANIPEKAVHIIFHQMEKPKNPDLKINTEKTSAADSALKIFDFLKEKYAI